MTKKPNSVTNLNRALYRLAGSDLEFIALRDYIASVVVSQLLDGCVIKGGASLKLRYGLKNTRYTNDLDTALSVDNDTFINKLRKNLSLGWEGFTGNLIIGDKAHPENIPEKYIMQPFDIKLLYLNKPFCTVRLETTLNEINDADVCEKLITNESKMLFNKLGFSEPLCSSVMSLSYQIAQKLHGLSEPGSQRVHDLVDLQIIFNNSKVDYVELNTVCKRLFSYRKMQSWPPKIVENNNWTEQYSIHTKDLDIIDNLHGAINWCNNLINNIANAI